MLLVIDTKLDGIVRERLLVAYYRYRFIYLFPGICIQFFESPAPFDEVRQGLSIHIL